MILVVVSGTKCKWPLDDGEQTNIDRLLSRVQSNGETCHHMRPCQQKRTSVTEAFAARNVTICLHRCGKTNNYEIAFVTTIDWEIHLRITEMTCKKFKFSKESFK